MTPSRAQPSERAPERRALGGTVAAHLLGLAGFLWLAGLAVRSDAPSFRPALATDVLPNKVLYYEQHARDFDTVFLGDSRTFAGIETERVDRALGTRSANLSVWANWFPTQYAMLRDLLPHVPSGTTVVWSIGHQNFAPIEDTVKDVYPLGWHRVPRYLAWGYPWERLHTNLKHHTSATARRVPGVRIYVEGQRLRGRLDDWLEANAWSARAGGARATPTTASSRPEGVVSAGRRVLPLPQRDKLIWQPNATTGDLEHIADLLALVDDVRDDPEVKGVLAFVDGDEVTSGALYKAHGSYVRVELDPAFFRAKQAELAAEVGPVHEVRADPAYDRTFQAILELLAERDDLCVIVNEMAEAPYHYVPEPNRAVYADFMQRIRERVEAAGVPYVRVDFDRLENADYFDFNHLNRRGIEKFTPMLVRELERERAACPAVEGAARGLQ